MSVEVESELAPEVEEFLAHHGVKGMKWGKRKSSGSSSESSSEGGSSSRSELRSLNKASKANDKAARNKEIDDARARYESGARDKYKAAKAQYQIDKATIGKREASKAFNKVKDENLADYNAGNQIKSGKETAVFVLSAVGASVLYSLAFTR